MTFEQIFTILKEAKKQYKQNNMKEIISDKVTWIDIVAPREQELEALQKELGLPNSLLDELRVPSLRDKVKIYDKFIYTVLYFPI